MAERTPLPSALFNSQIDALRDAGRLGPVLDLACGRGRHAVPAVRAGLPLIGVDRSAQFLSELRARAEALGEDIPVLQADLERECGLPFREEGFGAVLVFRYLHRPLCERISELLAPGGLLIYETFTEAQRQYAHGPKRPEFLLRADELPELFTSLEVTSYEEVQNAHPRPEAVARLIARKPRHPGPNGS